MRRPIRFVVCAALVAGVALLGACTSELTRPSFPPITFKDLPVIDLDVARIDYVREYKAPGVAPFVDHLFPQPPAAVARNWADDRLRAVGVSRTARVTLIDARVVSEALKTTPGIEGWFTVDQEEELDAHVEMRIDILGDDGAREAYASAEARRKRTLPEDLTLNQRDQIAYDLTRKLMNDLNAELERNIKTYLARYLR